MTNKKHIIMANEIEEEVEDINEGGEGGGNETKFVEVDGKKFTDDGTGKPKVGADGKPEPFVENSRPPEAPEARKSRLERQLEQHKKKHPELYETPPNKKEKKGEKSNDLDYGQKAFLSTQGFKGSKEFEFVQKELKASGLELETLLENGYFQANLEKFRNLNKTSEATIKGKRSNGVATESVEYWAGKPFEEVPLDMRQEVVNFKLKKENNKGKFYNQ